MNIRRVVTLRSSEYRDLEEAYSELRKMESDGLYEHGSDYQRSRQIYLRNLLRDSNQPAHVRGWIRQELNRLARGASARAAGRRGPGGDQARLRGVPSYDVGHQPGFAGRHDNWRRFRLEFPSTNRSRPGIARRGGFHRKYYESLPRGC